jgi:hypothetical protein
MNIKQSRVFGMGSLAIALGLLSGLAPELGAQAGYAGRECSNASLEGTYGAYRTGTAPFGAVAAQEIWYFDGEGSFNATVNISRNGEISLDEYYEGGYTVNADCTGEIDEFARIVIVNDGNGYYLVNILGGITQYEVGTRIHKGRRN